MRIVLVDDDARMREVLQRQLAAHPVIDVVGEAADGRAALERVRELAPDIVLMDVVMPGMGGIKATRLVLAALPLARVIGLSLHEDRHFVAAMRAVGRPSFITRVAIDRSSRELSSGLRRR